jgi:hypothetical protein
MVWAARQTLLRHAGLWTSWRNIAIALIDHLRGVLSVNGLITTACDLNNRHNGQILRAYRIESSRFCNVDDKSSSLSCTNCER